MKYFHIIFITFIAFAHKSHTFSNAEDSQMGVLPRGGFESAKIQASPHPAKLVHNYRSRDDHDDVAHESRYKPHRDFHTRPIHFIKRTGPEVGTRMVEIERRPISQHIYRIFIKDSPNFRLNHIIQSGELTPYERSLLRVPQREHVSNWTYGFSSTSDKYQEVVRGETIVKGLNKKLGGGPNDSTYTRSILLESSPGILTTQSTSVTKAEASLSRTDGKAENKRISTTKYGLLAGTTRKGNDKKTDRFELVTDKTSRPESSEAGVYIQTTTFKLSPRIFTQPYVIPTNVYGDLSTSKAIKSSSRSETLQIPRNKEIPRPEDVSSRNETSHIMKLPKTNKNQAAAENDEDSLKTVMGSWDSTKPTYLGRDSVKTHSPEPVPTSAIDFRRSTVFNHKSTRIDHYFQDDGLNNKISRTQGEVTTTFLKLPTVTAPTLPANPHDTSKTHAAEDFLKWKKGYGYPAYGKHSSGEVIRRKMILDMKSGLLKNTKFLDENGYSKNGDESDAPAKRHYPVEKYCEGVNCERIKKSPKPVNYLTEGRL